MRNKKFNKKFNKHQSDSKDVAGTYLTVTLRHDESPESLALRFKRMYKRSGLQDEVRNSYLGYHKTKSEKKREKHVKAVKRLKRDQRSH